MGERFRTKWGGYRASTEAAAPGTLNEVTLRPRPRRRNREIDKECSASSQSLPCLPDVGCFDGWATSATKDSNINIWLQCWIHRMSDVSMLYSSNCHQAVLSVFCSPSSSFSISKGESRKEVGRRRETEERKCVAPPLDGTACWHTRGGQCSAPSL